MQIYSKDLLLSSGKPLSYYENRQMRQDSIAETEVSWYHGTLQRYVGPANLIPGKKYVYTIVTGGEWGPRTSTTWAGTQFYSRGYNYGIPIEAYNFTYSNLYRYNNSNRPVLHFRAPPVFQGTFIADSDGTSTYIATVSSFADNKTPSIITAFDYDLVKSLFIRAGNESGFLDETI